jgi:hypothetical protein
LALTGAVFALTGIAFALTRALFALVFAAADAAFLVGLFSLTALFLLFPRCGISILSGCEAGLVDRAGSRRETAAMAQLYRTRERFGQLRGSGTAADQAGRWFSNFDFSVALSRA